MAIVPCPADETLIAMVERMLAPETLAEIAEHVDACATCRHIVASLAPGASGPIRLPPELIRQASQ